MMPVLLRFEEWLRVSLCSGWHKLLWWIVFGLHWV